MTRLFLAAGVAALAIAAPTAAKPGGGHGGGQAAAVPQGGGGGGHGGGSAAFRGGGHGGGSVAFRGGGGRGGGFAAFRGGGGHGGGNAQQQAFTRQQFRGGHGQGQMFARQQARGGHAQQQAFARQQFRGGRGQQQAFARQQFRGGHDQQQAFARQQFRGGHNQQQAFARQQFRGGHGQQQAFAREQFRRGHGQQQTFARQQFRGEHGQQQVFVNQQMHAGRMAANDQFRFNHQMDMRDRIAASQQFEASRFAALNRFERARFLDPVVADGFLGAPLTRVSAFAALSPLPPAVSYLYPDTPDYYYRYGNGYLYGVDRSTNLIASLLPLLGGGYLPGQYLPNSYMSSYVPDYYGFNSFYPDYGNDCNRYANGVVYEVDCYTGMVEDVIPLYAGGYGVGQMLPSSYAYYNVPIQYRSLYYNTPDYNYWYSPGAIYQYDPSSSMITSVAALMSPGFSVGQPLPLGYDVYNVPYQYRATYYDTPNAMYRYNNGYIYQVDPVTRLVTAIVASLLT